MQRPDHEMVRTRFERGPDNFRSYRVAHDEDRQKRTGIIYGRANVADELDSIRRGQVISAITRWQGVPSAAPDRIFRRFDQLDVGYSKIQQQLSKGSAPLRIAV
jgi:hypothetical protein